MDGVQHIPLKDAARLWGKLPGTVAAWLRRKRIHLPLNPEDGREKMVPLSALPDEVHRAFIKDQVPFALHKATGQPAELPGGGEAVNQPRLPFAVPSQKERAPVRAAPAGIPESQRPRIEQWLSVLGDLRNGTWQRFVGHTLGGILIQSREHFLHAQAAVLGKGFSYGNIRLKLSEYDRIIRDPSIAPEQKLNAVAKRIIIPKVRTGRSGHDFFSRPENAWQGAKLAALYLTEAKHSVKRAHELLHNIIDADQRVWGAKRTYSYPTIHHCRTFLKNLDSPTLILARDGEEAYRNRCEVSLSRNPDSLRSGELWVTDQRLVNVILQDAGHQLGRIWMVNDSDVASFRWLGCAFGPVLDSDMVMMAHARAIAKDGHLPQAIHHDQGKEFNCTAFNGSFRRISGEALYRDSIGFWQRVGVTPVGAIGGNPQSKTIERWHAEVDKFEKHFLTWCGGNTDERPEQLDALLAGHKAYWFRGEGKDPGIPTIEGYITRFVDWCATEWNARHRGKGKYLRGMTPDQAYYAKRRPEGFRLISLEELELKSAEHRMVTVRRGGQVNLTFWGVQVEYIAPELFQFAGAQPAVEVEVIISRRDFSAVTVLYPVAGGRESCTATIKSQFDWLPKGEEARERLRAAMRAKNRAKRAVKEGIKACQQLADAENPITLLENQQALPPGEKLAGQKTFGTPAPPLGYPEVSSTEFMGQRMGLKPQAPRHATSEEVADAALRSLEEEG